MISLRISKLFVGLVVAWVVLLTATVINLEEWNISLFGTLILLAFVIMMFSDFRLAPDGKELQLAIFSLPYVRLPIEDIASVEKHSVGRLLLHPWDIFNFYTGLGSITPLGLLINRGTIYLFVTKKGPNFYFCPLHINQILLALDQEPLIRNPAGRRLRNFIIILAALLLLLLLSWVL